MNVFREGLLGCLTFDVVSVNLLSSGSGVPGQSSFKAVKNQQRVLTELAMLCWGVHCYLGLQLVNPRDGEETERGTTSRRRWVVRAEERRA